MWGTNIRTWKNSSCDGNEQPHSPPYAPDLWFFTFPPSCCKRPGRCQNASLHPLFSQSLTLWVPLPFENRGTCGPSPPSRPPGTHMQTLPVKSAGHRSGAHLLASVKNSCCCGNYFLCLVLFVCKMDWKIFDSVRQFLIILVSPPSSTQFLAHSRSSLNICWTETPP